MTYKKWPSFLVLSIFLIIPSVSLAQTNIRIGRTTIPRNEKVGVVNVLPRNEDEFKSIFDKKPTRAQTAHIERTQRQVDRLKLSILKPYPAARTSVGFDTYVRQAPEQTIMLVGHNVNGKFRFADGSALSLAQIASLVNEQNKQAIVLSCDAKSYVPQFAASTRPLTDRDAIRMIESIGNTIGRTPPTNGESKSLDIRMMNRVQADITRTENLLNLESVLKRTAVVGTITTGAVTGTGYMFERRRRNKKR